MWIFHSIGLITKPYITRNAFEAPTPPHYLFCMDDSGRLNMNVHMHCIVITAQTSYRNYSRTSSAPTGFLLASTTGAAVSGVVERHTSFANIANITCTSHPPRQMISYCRIIQSNATKNETATFFFRWIHISTSTLAYDFALWVRFGKFVVRHRYSAYNSSRVHSSVDAHRYLSASHHKQRSHRNVHISKTKTMRFASPMLPTCSCSLAPFPTVRVIVCLP